MADLAVRFGRPAHCLRTGTRPYADPGAAVTAKWIVVYGEAVRAIVSIIDME